MGKGVGKRKEEETPKKVHDFRETFKWFGREIWGEKRRGSWNHR